MAGRGSFRRKKELQPKPVFAPVSIGSEVHALGGYHEIADFAEKFEQAEMQCIKKELGHLLQGGNEDLRIEYGFTLSLLGETEQAREELTRAEQELPENALAPYALALLLMESSKLPADKKNSEESRWSVIVSQLREAIQLDPNNIPAHYHLGHAIRKLVEEESYVDAIEVYTKYLEAGAPLGFEDEVQDFINEQDSAKQLDAALTKGHESFRTGNYRASIDAFTDATELGSKEAYYYLGLAYEKTGAYGKAVDIFEKAEVSEQLQADLNEALGRATIALFCDLKQAQKNLLGLQQAPTTDRRLSATPEPTQQIQALGLEMMNTLAQFLPHHDQVIDLYYTANDQNIVTTGLDNKVKVWDWSSGRPIKSKALEGEIYDSCLSEDGKQLAIVKTEANAIMTSTIHLIDLESMEEIQQYTASTDANSIQGILFHDHQLLFVEVSDKMLASFYYMDTHSGEVAAIKKRPPRNEIIKESPNIQLKKDDQNRWRPGVFNTDNNLQILFYPELIKLKDNWQVQRLKLKVLPKAHQLPVNATWLHDGEILLGVSPDGRLAAIVQDGRQTENQDMPLTIRPLINETNQSALPTESVKGQDVAKLYFLQQGYIISFNTGNAQLLQKDGQVKNTFDLGGEMVTKINCSADEKQVAFTLANGAILLFDIDSGTRLQRLPFEGFPAWKAIPTSTR